MSRKLSTFLLILTVVVIGLQLISVNLTGQTARKPDTSLNRNESGSNVAGDPQENPAPQSPGPDLPIPLTAVEEKQMQELVLEHGEGKIPATPADPYEYCLTWEEELANIKGIKAPVVVIWQKNLYLAYRGKAGTNTTNTLVKTEVIKRVRFLEPSFDKILISDKQNLRQQLLQIQKKMKAGQSPGKYVLKLEEQFKR